MEPGLIHIRQAFSIDQQKELIRAAMEIGEDKKNGFWNDKKELNCTPYRGRVFKAMDTLPNSISSIAQHVLNFTENMETPLQFAAPTHMLLLYYKALSETPPNGFIPWHQDNGDNDGKDNYPVISVSLGESCDFLVCHEKPKISGDHSISNPVNLAHRLRYSSGDVLIFGDECRMIWHSIYNMHLNSCSLLPGARINMTFRYAPEILGEESRFAKIGTIEKDNRFFKISLMK